MQRLLIFVLLSMVGFFSVTFNAVARGKLGINFFHQTTSSTNSGVETNTTRQLMDLSGGLIMNNGLSFGGCFAAEKNDTTSIVMATNSRTETNEPRTSYGPYIGYEDRTFRFEAVYYPVSKWVTDAISEIFLKGWGYQINIAYKIDLKGWAIGPMVTYRNFTYDKQDTRGVVTNLQEKRKVSYFEPAVGLSLHF